MNIQLPNTGAFKTYAAATLIAIAFPTLSSAEDVQLDSLDGSMSISGAFVDYQDGRYTVDTPIGQILVSAFIVTCEGDVCPSMQTILTDLRATDDGMSGLSIMPAGSTDPECESAALKSNNPA